AMMRETEMRRAQEGHERFSSEARFEKLKDEIERSRERFRGKRHRVRRFVENAGALEHFTSHVEVWQWTFEDHSRPIERRRALGVACASLCKRDQFLLSVANREERRRHIATRN